MIYLDHAASTQPFDDVIELYFSLNKECFGNSSSAHAFGAKAAKLVEESRESILKSLNLSKDFNLVFTSGASESNNMAIKGLCFKYQNRGKKILVGATEHPSVLSAFEQLRDNFGFEMVVLPVNNEGEVEPGVLKDAMDSSVILVSIMAVNNETGTINDIGKLGDIVHQYPKAFFHVDSTQAIGKVSLPYEKADLLSFSGHKIGGLKGTGALIYKKKIQFIPLVSGGEQEKGIRAGTVNAPGDAALALAVKLSIQGLGDFNKKATTLKEILVKGLLETNELVLNSPSDSAPFVTSFSFKHHKSSVMEEYLSEREIYVSSFSACSTHLRKTSAVLLAMGKSEEDAENSMRVSFGHDTTIEEVKAFIETLRQGLAEVKTR